MDPATGLPQGIAANLLKLTPEELEQVLNIVRAAGQNVNPPMHPPRPLTRQHITPPFREWDLVQSEVQIFLSSRHNAFLSPIALPTFVSNSATTSLPRAPRHDHPIHLKIAPDTIPAFLGSPSLLLHRLEDVSAHTTISAQIEEAVGLGHQITFLMGTSGAGKTRSALELLSRRYGLYFSARVGSKGGPGAQDFQQMVDRMAGKSQSFVKAQLEENAAVVEHWVMALLVARLEVLSEYLKVAGAAATPYQFAIMQLVPAYVLPHNSELPSDRAVGDDALVQLTAILRHAKVEDLRQRARDCLRSFRRADGGRALPVVVDEVQVLLEESTKRYAATTDSAQERPLYTPVIGTILSLNPMNVESILPVVVSGTGLSITEAEEKSGSMVGKGVASTVRVICRSGQNFKAFRKYLQLFVDLDDSAGDEQVKGWWSRIYSMLRGRPRFAAVFVELCIRVLSGSPGGVGSLGALLAKVWETLLRSDSDKSVYAAVHRLRTRNRPDLWQFAVDVCASYLYSGCPVVFFREKHLQLVEMGLAQLQTGVGSQSLEGRIDEPLVAWAMFQYCRDHDMHLAERVFHWMGLQKSNPSSSGFLWESVLPEELFKLFNNDRPMKEHPLFAHLGSRLPPYFNYPAVIHRPNLVGPIAVKASDTYRLANFLANPLAPFFLPEFRAGPDIAFAIDFQTKPPTTIACFLQAKLAVKVGDKRAAKLTTCPERFYSRKGETGLVPEREDVIQALLERYNRAQGVVRIMLAFPTALDSTNYSTSSHPTTRMTRSQAMASPAYPDVEIIVDVNNIAQFATKEHVAFLENLKGGEFEHSISEVGVGFEVDEEEEEEGGFGMEIDW